MLADFAIGCRLGASYLDFTLARRRRVGHAASMIHDKSCSRVLEGVWVNAMPMYPSLILFGRILPFSNTSLIYRRCATAIIQRNTGEDTKITDVSLAEEVDINSGEFNIGLRRGSLNPCLIPASVVSCGSKSCANLLNCPAIQLGGLPVASRSSDVTWVGKYVFLATSAVYEYRLPLMSELQHLTKFFSSHRNYGVEFARSSPYPEYERGDCTGTTLGIRGPSRTLYQRPWVLRLSGCRLPQS